MVEIRDRDERGTGPGGGGGTETASRSRRRTEEPPARATAWFLILDPSGRSGAENMAIDVGLLDEAARRAHPTAFVRLYRWSPPCMSFGRHEPVRRRYDLDAIRRLGLDTVRRPTGGRAVWHDREVTYAVAAPTEMFGALSVTYIRIHTMLRDALQRLGANVELAPQLPGRPVRLDIGACFATPAGGEIVLGGRKLVGSAQVRRPGAFLQHGSILLEDRQDRVAQVARGSHAAPRAAALADVLGRPVSFEEVAQAIAAEAQAAWSGTWRAAGARVDPERLAHFADPAWTWRH